MRRFLYLPIYLLAGCASLPGQSPDPTGTLIALAVIQGGANLATNNCVALAPPDTASACALPPNASQAQQQATIQQCFAASLLTIIYARHRALFCPPTAVASIPPVATPPGLPPSIAPVQPPATGGAFIPPGVVPPKPKAQP